MLFQLKNAQEFRNLHDMTSLVVMTEQEFEKKYYII